MGEATATIGPGRLPVPRRPFKLAARLQALKDDAVDRAAEPDAACKTA